MTTLLFFKALARSLNDFRAGVRNQTITKCYSSATKQDSSVIPQGWLFTPMCFYRKPHADYNKYSIVLFFRAYVLVDYAGSLIQFGARMRAASSNLAPTSNRFLPTPSTSPWLVWSTLRSGLNTRTAAQIWCSNHRSHYYFGANTRLLSRIWSAEPYQ